MYIYIYVYIYIYMFKHLYITLAAKHEVDTCQACRNWCCVAAQIGNRRSMGGIAGRQLVLPSLAIVLASTALLVLHYGTHGTPKAQRAGAPAARSMASGCARCECVFGEATA